MDGIKTFATNRLTWISAGYLIAFCGLARLAPDNSVSELVRTFTTAMGLVGMIAYGEAAVRAYQARRWPNPELIAAAGMFTIATGVGIGGLFQTLWRLSGFRTFIVNNDFYSFTVSLIGVGLFILVAVPNIIGRGVPRWTRVRIILAWAFTAGGVLGLVIVSPDLGWLAEALKPYLSEPPR